MIAIRRDSTSPAAAVTAVLGIVLFGAGLWWLTRYAIDALSPPEPFIYCCF